MPRFPSKDNRQAIALVIVLAFIVLVTGLIVAFFSRAVLDRQISNSSASQAKVAIFAAGAMDQIAGDLKQEIVDSSSNTGVNIVVVTGSFATPLYYPLSNATMTPYRPGTNGGSNVVTTSGTGPLYPLASGTYNKAGPNRASIALTTGTSINGRYMTLVRWSKPLLFGTNSFIAPNWILVGRDGSNPTTFSNSVVYSSANTTAVIGRYAYVIYDEGGLLDVNVAGYPSTTATAQSAYKNPLGYADLTQLGLTPAQSDSLVGWRNYASTQAPGAFPNPAFTAASGSNYYNYVTSNTTGFLTTGTYTNGAQTDKMFVSRQALIDFMTQGLGLSGTQQNVLQYLGTFSRTLDQPSFVPAVQTNAAAPVVLATNLGGNNAYGGDNLINPSFLNVQVQASFTRNDGLTAVVGQPLVLKRFALNRLAWITYKGPSASRTQTDSDIQALINDGIPWSYLQLGTTTNIQNYFGLNWDSTNNRWQYNVHNGGGSGSGKIMLVGRPAGTAANPATYVEDANREPDFFELLKAGISVGSLGKAAVSSSNSVTIGTGPTQRPPGYVAAQIPLNFRYAFDTSVDYHIIQIGANILSEVNPTSYPIRITLNDGSARGVWEFQGVTDLPYLSYIFNGVLRTQLPNPPVNAANGTADAAPFQYPVAVSGTATLASSGTAYMIQVPAVWNPYDPNGAIPPSVLRPSQFRIVVDSNDPVSLSSSGTSSDLPIWHAAEATNSTNTNPGGTNQGVGANVTTTGAIYSFNVTGVGKTTEEPVPPGPAKGTAVSDAVTFSDVNGALYREPTLIFSTAVGGASRTAGNIISLDANPLPGETDGSKGPWAPLVIGQFPLAFASGTSGTATTYYTGAGTIGLAAGNGDQRVFFTYRLQYADPIITGNWVTYDTKYGRTTPFTASYQFQSQFNYTPCIVSPPGNFNTYAWASAIDPRTARFGLITSTINPGRSSEGSLSGTSWPTAGSLSGTSQAWSPPDWLQGSWIYGSSGAPTVVGITNPIRQDNSGGFYSVSLDAWNYPNGVPNGDDGYGLLAINNSDVMYPGCVPQNIGLSGSAGWTNPIMPIFVHNKPGIWVSMFAPGMYAQNNPGAPFYEVIGAQPPYPGPLIEPSYYADADGVVRRAAGAYVAFGGTASATTTVGLPPPSIQGYPGAPQTAAGTTPATTTPFTQAQSRPLLLHRPFLTVAELGYVFRDLPWKNLDFFAPESADAPLLDLFCINDTSDPTGLVAGKVNLNTFQAPVLQAIVSGAYVDNPQITNATVGSVSPSVASAISSALVARTSGTNYGPLENLSELVGKWNAATKCAPPSGVTYAPTFPSGNSFNCGIDLPLASGYMDGKLSYVGFSGAPSVSGTVNNLTDAYYNALSGSLYTSMSQVKRFREAPIRALASAGQTRVWNLMIDVVAQTGRYPSSASTLNNFVVEGEQRYWLHVAIDRFTGQIIDKQLEVVKE